MDANRQWFKSKVGLLTPETPRDQAFCAHTILGTGPLLIPDALLDERFAENPLVTGAPHIRFYAGHPLLAENGMPIGTLCLLDSRQRDLNDAQLSMLKDLAILVERELQNPSPIDLASSTIAPTV